MALVYGLLNSRMRKIARATEAAPNTSIVKVVGFGRDSKPMPPNIRQDQTVTA